MYLHLQEVVRPASLEACLEALRRDRSAALGGGSFLNVAGHEALERLVDLQALALRGIDVSSDLVCIGALTPIADLARAALPAGLEALTQAAAAEKNRAIANVSTVGGRLCRDAADARLLTALVALDAQVSVRVRGEATEQRVPVATFATAAWQRERRGSYLLTGVLLEARGGRSAYRGFSMTAVDAPYADAAVFVGDGVTRIAVGGLGATAEGVVRATAAESADRGADGWQATLRAALEPTLPSYTTPRAGGDYRRDVATTLVVRLLEEVTA